MGDDDLVRESVAEAGVYVPPGRILLTEGVPSAELSPPIASELTDALSRLTRQREAFLLYYQHFLGHDDPPLSEELASAMGISPESARWYLGAARHRLQAYFREDGIP